jgi:GNAT superfamily N-acetyltransferase
MLRRATLDDAQEIAALLDETRRVSMPYLPVLHTPEEFLEFVQNRVLPQWDTWVVDVRSPPADPRIVGVMALHADHVEQLFVLPPYQRRGLGTLLLDKAKQLRPDRLTLWVFQANVMARAFYARHGFHVIRTTEDQNEERMPDALLEWAPTSVDKEGPAAG